MHKCPECGQEYDGKFCPNCGAQWQDEKICPTCGAKLDGSARFCTECGYSFVKNENEKKTAKTDSQLKQKLSTAIEWIKKHLKIVIPVALAVIIAIILACTIPACVKAKYNGTYYKLKSDGELDKKTYFILKSGTWTDEDGESGSYKKSGDDVTFYYTFFGETEELCSGTLKDYVLTIKVGGATETYLHEKHNHNFGEWEVKQEVSCTADGKNVRTCLVCGFTETETISKVPHTTEYWEFDNQIHYKTCTVCNTVLDEGEHTGESICVSCGYVYGETIGLDLKLSGSKESYYVNGIGSVTDTEIVIPNTFRGLPITSIVSEAFKDCTSLTSIIISDSVTYIGSSAFSGCTSLTSVTIGSGVTSIKSETFYNCTSLTNITIPNSVTYIGEYAFNKTAFYNDINNWENDVLYIGNHLIKAKTTLSGKYEIKQSTISVADLAFYRCTSLTSITIPNSVTSFGSSAFRNCISLTSITIPDSVTYIGSYAFSDCTSLTSITIPDSVTYIGERAFNDCPIANAKIPAIVCEYINNVKLKSVIILGGKSIGIRAFYGCSSLESITLSDSVTTICDYAFYGCTSLTSITIPDSVTSIGSSAFYGCSSLKSITIPGGVTLIGGWAFYACTLLTSVKFENTTGWYANGSISSSDLTDSAKAAQYLKYIYCGYEWKRSET